jgi:hypothetical protein
MRYPPDPGDTSYSLAFLQVEGPEETIVYTVREESRGQRSIDSPVSGESILLTRNTT